MKKEFNIKVKVITKEKTYEGILLESHDSKIILLKLKNGYNIGIKKDSILKITKLSNLKEQKTKKTDQDKTLPKIAIIATGGTIASKVDYQTGGVLAVENPYDLLENFPELKKIIRFEVHVPFSDDSSQVSPKEWVRWSKLVAKLVNMPQIKGVVILHGTDTLHYSASALSFMLHNLNKPVVFTFSQRSVDRGSSDSFLNIRCACHAALSNIAEVMVVGHEKSDDDSCLMIRGTKVRKMHSSIRGAFKPINENPLAKVFSDGRIDILNHKFRKRHEGKVKPLSFFEEKTALVKFFPGSSSEILDSLIKKGYKGIIIEAVGLGQLPVEGTNSWLTKIKQAIYKKIFVGVTSQTIYGRVNPYVYSPSRKVEKAGAVYLKDMLSETAYVKLGWLLGQKKKFKELSKEMLENKSHEFNERMF
ncbi:MAG: Glu-tRNA(Gln) amidotransferase subunit GatD [archaeon]|nr:MAG: Glu-tRNA(Gln) amidotransferase subunit GatD [archaeon]